MNAGFCQLVGFGFWGGSVCGCGQGRAGEIPQTETISPRLEWALPCLACVVSQQQPGVRSKATDTFGLSVVLRSGGWAGVGCGGLT